MDYECRYFWPEPVYLNFMDGSQIRLMPGEKYEVKLINDHPDTWDMLIPNKRFTGRWPESHLETFNLQDNGQT